METIELLMKSERPEITFVYVKEMKRQEENE